MNTAKDTNVKSIIVISLVSILLFGIFYYLITDVSSSSTTLKSEKSKGLADVSASVMAAEQVVTTEPADQPAGDVKGTSTESNEPQTQSEVSVFKALTTQKVDTKPGEVLGGSDAQTPESTVPTTGSETIFAAFVVSSLIMFTGIFLLLTQPKNVALAKFEKRIIKELD